MGVTYDIKLKDFFHQVMGVKRMSEKFCWEILGDFIHEENFDEQVVCGVSYFYLFIYLIIFSELKDI